MKTFVRTITILILSAGVLSSSTVNKDYSEPSGNLGIAIPDTVTSGGFVRVDTFDLNIIPPSSGVRFYRDGILFLSSSKAENKMLTDHVSFGRTEAMYAALRDLTLADHTAFSSSVKFTYPCDAMTFSKDYKTVYFTKRSDTEGVEKIFKAVTGEGGTGIWTVDETPLSFCTGNSIYTHPALSDDGKILIFSSNRDGTIGSMDLFISQLEGGSWSDPKNLGDAINTRADEMYPFLDAQNNLYYSSDGLLGYGGYDIYVCKFKGNTWEAPVNLTNPVNTIYDDVAFSIDNQNGKTAFYTIKEKEGKKSVKLLKVTMTGTLAQDNVMNLSQFFTNPATRNIVLIVTEPAVEATDRAETTDRARGRGEGNIVYRVQILTSFNPKTRQIINLEGQDYAIYEYLYSGAYRLCVGEFSTISPAIELRNKFIQNDYPQATVVVFRNNVRSFDPELLEEPAGLTAVAQQPQAEAQKVTQPVVEVKAEVQKEAPAAETKKPEPQQQAPPVITETKPAEQPKTVPPPTETRKEEPAKPAPQAPEEEKKDIVVYRVQIITNTTAKGSYKITIANKAYDTYEYKYAGAYRTCVGEFSTLAPAREFQNICRKNGHAQAFVVAFKNGVRSTEAALFK